MLANNGPSIFQKRPRVLRTVNPPSAKTPTKISFFLHFSRDCRKMGIGMRIIMMSDEMLSTALVMRWFVAAEHCAEKDAVTMTWCRHDGNQSKDSLESGGTAQY